MNRITKRIICGIVTIALILSLLTHMGKVKEVDASGTANDVVGIANSQIGYKEKANGNYLDDFTANAGAANYTKYHRDLGYSQGQEWCAIFTRWVLQSAGVSSSEWPSGNDKYVPNWQQHYINKGKYHSRGTYSPKPGDLVIISWSSSGTRDHIGIIESADGTAFNYISGNRSNAVVKEWMSQSNTMITGYCEVTYNTDVEKPVVTNVKVSNITGNGYDVTCNVSDNVGVTCVRFPTWTSSNGQDDLIWHEGSVSNGVASFHVKISDHNNEFGVYCTDVYAYDAAGNQSDGVGAERVTLIETTCASGTLNGHEYVVYKDSLTATEARAKEGNGYHLATITSADEYNFIMNLTKKISKQPEGYWFGANDLTKEGVFTWETGEPFDYALWPDGQPDNNGGSLGEEDYFGIWSSGIWNDFSEAYKLGYVLEKDPPASVASGTLGDHEYKISAAYMTRTEAEQYQTDGWYLATITSSEERDYVLNLIKGLREKNLNGYWLGGSDIGHEGTFTWDNGEEFSYAPWGSGEPNNKDGFGRDEDHLAIYNNGKFNDYNESYRLGYVLEYDPESRMIKVDTINLTSDRDETKDSYEDDTFQLTAEVLPEEATDKTVTRSSSDTDYATVDDSGKVKVNSSIPDTIKTIIITASNSDGTVVATYSFVVCPKSSCEHNWNTGTIIKEATCSEYGEMEYTCSKCGTTKLEIIGLKAHTPIDDDEVLATCDKEGKTKGSHCSVCGKVISEQTTVPALGHQFGDYIPNNDETCIANGTATAICERCGKSDSIIIEDSASGVHIWGEYEITKPATCTEIGVKTRKCINCNKTSSAGIVKAAHEYVEVVTKEPTCTEKGTVTFTCANCGDTYDEDIEPLGHNEVPDPAIAATSTSTGLTEGSHCSRCNTVLIEQQIIPKLEECTNHVWGEYVVTTEPTCTTVGVKTRYCQVCGKKSTLGIPIVAHNYVEEVQKESTCGEAGILKKTCSMCGDEKYESLEKKAHTIVTDPAVAATANSTGLTEGSHCSVCGTVMKAQEVIPVLSDDSYKENNKPDVDNTNSDSSNGSQTDGAAGNNSNHYSSEWVDGKWYDANGNQTYEGTLQWKSNSVGWWVEDSAGWYPQNSWQKIDGVWYFFKPDGYMASGEYYNGYWFNGNGSWDPTYQLSWKSNSTGWWVEDVSGWWPSNSWLKIDGYWYYFNSSGYMVTSQYIDGYWIGADGVYR